MNVCDIFTSACDKVQLACPSMMSKSSSLWHFEHSLKTGTFQHIQSEGNIL